VFFPFSAETRLPRLSSRWRAGGRKGKDLTLRVCSLHVADPHRKAWRPKARTLPLHIIRFSAYALQEGIEVHKIEGVPVRIYSAAKTVADCFKYRNKIGLDVALEALRESQRERKCTMDELWYFAKVCRVANVMRPYLEAIV